jgi:hypothetical protein
MRFLVVALCAVAACGQAVAPPQDAFFSSLTALCGKAFAGRLVSTDDADKGFAAERLMIEVRTCSNDEIRIPFHVGADRSRTWVITRSGPRLRLKHDHRHQDGSPDVVTMYGGDAARDGTSSRQEFPVDQYSVGLFTREGLTASVTNVWAVETTGAVFAYELRHENRFFRVEFDLTKPVANPPPPWGPA